MSEQYDYDYLIVGSGFGGSVSALRLAEKGWRVAVVEQGRRIGPAEITAVKNKPSKQNWLPALRQDGYFAQHVFRHVSILGGVGVGGGSLVWAAVMLRAKPGFYADPLFQRLGIDMRAELEPHYATAEKMLGVTTNPLLTQQDHHLRDTAERMGRAETFSSTPQAIYFGKPGETTADPYFDGEGPDRTGCRFCAGCISGCPYNSKNSLPLNYLYLAEKAGVEIIAERRADRIDPLPEGGYRVTMQHAWKRNTERTITAKNVVLSAGVVGTVELLFRNRDQYQTLPFVSSRLGQQVRTNSEAIPAILARDADEDMTEGTTVSSDFYADEHTHITQNRVDATSSVLRWLYGPMTDGRRPFPRMLKTLLAGFLKPRVTLSNWFGRNWHQRITMLTVMQDLDNQVMLTLQRKWSRPWKAVLATKTEPGQKSPSYLPIANKAARIFAEVSDGDPLSSVVESVGDRAVTAHILGGCPMGLDASEAVIDANHEVHGHPGLFVVDGAAIPANLGVNPSLTITAMSERFAHLQPSNLNPAAMDPAR